MSENQLKAMREQCRAMSMQLVRINSALEIARAELKCANDRLLQARQRHDSERQRLEVVIREQSVLLSQ